MTLVYFIWKKKINSEKTGINLPELEALKEEIELEFFKEVRLFSFELISIFIIFFKIKIN